MNWQFGRSSKWRHTIMCQGTNCVSERDRGARSVEGYCFQLVRFGLRVHWTAQVHSNQCSMGHPNLSEAETGRQLKSKMLLRKILILILCCHRLLNLQFQKLSCSPHLDVRHSHLQFGRVTKKTKQKPPQKKPQTVFHFWLHYVLNFFEYMIFF